MFQSYEVESSAINAVYYDAGNEELVIEYAGGGEYTYVDVPQEILNAMLSSESVGRYVNSTIKGSYDSVEGFGSDAPSEDYEAVRGATNKLKEAVEAVENARHEAVETLRGTKLRTSRHGINKQLEDMKDNIDAHFAAIANITSALEAK